MVPVVARHDVVLRQRAVHGLPADVDLYAIGVWLRVGLYGVRTYSRGWEGAHDPLKWHRVAVIFECCAHSYQLGNVALGLLVGVGPRHGARHAHDPAWVDDHRVGVEHARNGLLRVPPSLQVEDWLLKPPVGVAAHEWRRARLNRHGELWASKVEDVRHSAVGVGVCKAEERGGNVRILCGLSAPNLRSLEAVDWVDAHVNVLLGRVYLDRVLNRLVLPVQCEPSHADVAAGTDAADFNHRVTVDGLPALGDVPDKFSDGLCVGL